MTLIDLQRQMDIVGNPGYPTTIKEISDGTESTIRSTPSLDNVLIPTTGRALGIRASMVAHFSLRGAKLAFIDLAEEIA